MVETIGWIGSIAFAICGLPQAVQCYKTKSAAGLSVWFLLLWTVGEVCTMAYVVPKWQWPLIMNYSVNCIFLSVIWRYKLKEMAK